MPKFVLRALAPLSLRHAAATIPPDNSPAVLHWWQNNDIQNLLMTLGGE